MNTSIRSTRGLICGALLASLFLVSSQSSVGQPRRALTRASEACVARFEDILGRTVDAVTELERLAGLPAPAGLSQSEAAAYRERSEHLADLVRQLNGQRARIEQGMAMAVEAGREVNYLLESEYESRSPGRGNANARGLSQMDEQIRQAVWQVHRGEQ